MPPPVARTKAAKRRHRRALNAAARAKGLRLAPPAGLGPLGVAEAAVAKDAAARARRAAPAQAAKREKARQTPMQRYLARGEVTRQHFADAERLWSDYTRSGLTANVTGAYDQAAPAAGGPPTPGCGPRYAAYRDAMRAVGIILSPVLAWVALEGRSAAQWARDNRRPADEGIVTLRLALDALGAHYRGRRG